MLQQAKSMSNLLDSKLLLHGQPGKGNQMLGLELADTQDRRLAWLGWAIARPLRSSHQIHKSFFSSTDGGRLSMLQQAKTTSGLLARSPMVFAI